MRRKDKEIRDRGWMEEILDRAQVIRVAMAAGGEPYLVPMNFGYRDGKVYLHSAPEGRKIDMLQSNPRVFLEATADTELVSGDRPCGFGMRYRSVTASGTARILAERQEKMKALDIIAEKYAGFTGTMEDTAVDGTAVIVIDIVEMSGKQSGWE